MADEANQDKAAYDTAYQAEMDRLEAEAAGKTATTEAPAIETPKEEPKQETAAGDPDERFARLESELASTKKALNDTKKWAQESRAVAKRLEQERERERREAMKPEILVDNPGLEEAIQHVAGVTSKSAVANQDDWATAVGTALPELDQLLAENPELASKARAVAQSLGDDWNNPYVAIRELGKLQAEHMRAGVSAAAAAQAKQDFERRQQKQTAMSVPGNGGTARPAAEAKDDPNRWATMSAADFAKERAKVLGY